MITSAPTYVQKSLKEFDFSNLMNLNLTDIFPDEQKFEELKEHKLEDAKLGHRIVTMRDEEYTDEI